jgi:hypothetical protein
MDVIIKSNDPSHPSITVPVSMTVTAVPVEMTMLTAEVLNEDVLISWQTATESNNKGFKIERRKSDKNDPWNEIGFINGRGTTTEKTNYSFTDKKISSGKYKYRLKQIDLDGTFTYSKVIELEVNNPSEFSLMQNYPNPFNPKTMIGYSLPVKAKVEIRIYSSLGEYLFTIIDETKEAGFFTYEFDASRLTSGTYIYQMIANDGNRVYSDTKKMIFMK